MKRLFPLGLMAQVRGRYSRCAEVFIRASQSQRTRRSLARGARREFFHALSVLARPTTEVHSGRGLQR